MHNYLERERKKKRKRKEKKIESKFIQCHIPLSLCLKIDHTLLTQGRGVWKQVPVATDFGVGPVHVSHKSLSSPNLQRFFSLSLVVSAMAAIQLCSSTTSNIGLRFHCLARFPHCHYFQVPYCINFLRYFSSIHVFITLHCR